MSTLLTKQEARRRSMPAMPEPPDQKADHKTDQQVGAPVGAGRNLLFLREEELRLAQDLLFFGYRDFTAVFSSNDQMALGFLHAIRESGLDCPGDISIVGFDDIPEAAYLIPPLTTIRQDFTEVGRRSLDLMLAQLATGSRMDSKLLVPAQIVVRESTAPPRG